MKEMKKMRKPGKEEPYQVWENSRMGWKWEVYKSYQNDDDKPYARWFCKVYSPYVPNGELGDVYVKEIKECAVLIKDNVNG